MSAVLADIDFASINSAALAQYPGILESWLPGGRVNGREYVCANLHGGAGRSLSVNVECGTWADFAMDERGSDPVSLFAAIHNIGQGEAARRLADELNVNGSSTPEPRKKKSAWTPILPIPDDAPEPPATHYTKGRPVASWEYRDQQGRLLSLVCRFEHGGGKEIIPLCFAESEDGKRAWRWQSMPAPRPLYGLDRLKDHNAVVLVEGEKAADAAQRLFAGKAAVMTWPGGSKAVRKADFMPLQGKRVLLWPDADDPGEKAMQDVAAILSGIGVSSLKMLPPPEDAVERWDAADAEAEGWTHERVMQEVKTRAVEVEATEAPESDETPSARLNALDVAQFLSLSIPERQNVLSPIIPEQGLAMLYAPRGIGKTFVALSIAYAVASGGHALRWEAPEARRVLYIDGEMPARAMQERIAAIVRAGEKEPPAPDFLRVITPDMQPGAMPNVSSPEGQASLEPFLGGVSLVVVDNLSTLARHGRENEAESWLPVQGWILGLRRRGISVLLVHHAAKGGQQRGTSCREDVLDTVISLRRPPDYDPQQGARFHVVLEKARGLHGDDAKSFEALLTESPDGLLIWSTCDIENARRDAVLALKSEGLSLRDIAEETGIPKSTVSRIIKRAEQEACSA